MVNLKVVMFGVALVASAGCKKDEKKNSVAVGSGSGSAVGSGSDVAVGSGSDVAVGSGSAAATCDIVGDYRLRFASNGTDGWWWRFKVTGTADAPKGELVAPVEVLGIEKPGPVDVTADTKTCTLTVVAKQGSIGHMTLTATLDPATNQISGSIVRAKPRYPDEKVPHPAAGVRGPQTDAPSGACVTPGKYTLTFDAKHAYKSDTDGQECDIVMLEDLPISVEYLGDQVVIDLLDEKGDVEAGRIKVTSAKGCDVELQLGDSTRTAKGKLTFAADKITGTASEAEYQMIEDGEAGENMWNCSSKNVAITGAKK